MLWTKVQKHLFDLLYITLYCITICVQNIIVLICIVCFYYVAGFDISMLVSTHITDVLVVRFRYLLNKLQLMASQFEGAFSKSVN